MRIITDISIDHFRSIRDSGPITLRDFTALAGLNNSGKSNVLRALNAFFSGETDPGVGFRYAYDYYRYDLKSKKKRKNISISITFDLPSSFHFHKRLEGVEELLGRRFTIKKTWMRNSTSPRYYLNSSEDELSPDDINKVDQFLALINFRYIPNRVQPLEVIRSERRSLRDVIIRRLARHSKGQNQVFDSIKDTSATLIKALQGALEQASPNIGEIRLDTPTSWQDLIFPFGYKLATGGIEIEDTAQGSGIQSLLMLETLSLIDRDYFQKFGWRQAAIWAIEEPESSLHTLLEAQVAKYLADIVTDDKSRLQVICTTHSDLMLQSCSQTVFVERQNERSTFSTMGKKQVLEKAATLGVSRYTHPILAEPLRPLILVEGKYDCAFLEKVLTILAPGTDIRVSYLGRLLGGDSTGGDELLNYLKTNRNVIKVRAKEAPIAVLLDWDAKSKKAKYEKVCPDKNIYKVRIWPDSSFNPQLGECFRGIERHMSNRIIKEADAKVKVLGKTQASNYTVAPKEYNGVFKMAVYDVVKNGITDSDLLYVKDFINQLVTEIEGKSWQQENRNLS